MRILLVTQNFPPENGGIQTYSEELSKSFFEKGHHIEVIAPSKERLHKKNPEFPFRVIRFKVQNALLVLPLLWYMPFLLMKNKYNIIFHAQWQTAVASILAKIFGSNVKVVIAVHGRELLFNSDKEGLFPRVFAFYKKSVLSRADLLLPVSNFTKDLLTKSGVKAEKIKVIKNGTSPDIFYPKDVSKLKSSLNLSSKKIIFTLSRLEKRKGIDDVIKCLPDVIKDIPEVHYIIGGSGPEKEYLEELVNEYSLQEYVTFTDKIPDQEINDFYNLCDVFVLPSVTKPLSVEGFGIVFLEANACKKPVIGSDSGGIPDAILHNKTGLIVPESNTKSLSKAIIKILTNKKLAQELGENGYKRVIDELNWNRVTNKILSCINELFDR